MSLPVPQVHPCDGPLFDYFLFMNGATTFHTSCKNEHTPFPGSAAGFLCKPVDVVVTQGRTVSHSFNTEFRLLSLTRRYGGVMKVRQIPPKTALELFVSNITYVSLYLSMN